MKSLRITAIVLLVGSSVSMITADEVDCAAMFTTARAALDDRRFETSAVAFAKLADHCEDFLKRPTEHPFAFYQAMARHLQALNIPTEPDRQSTLFHEAERLYRDVLADKSDDTATLNNLALVIHALGREDEAKALFERALAFGGSSNAWYLTTYARFLVEVKDYDDATKYLEDALALDPALFVVKIGMFELLLSKTGADAAISYVSQMIPQNPEQTSRIVIESLSNPLWDTEHKKLAFSLAISAMASELSRTAAVSDALAELLRTAEKDHVVGAGAHELAALLSASPVEAASFVWWSACASQKSAADVSLWQSFRSFALAAGNIDARTGQYPVARSKYSLVLKLDSPRVTVEPVLKLAELYAASGDVKAFTYFVDRYAQYVASPSDERTSDTTALRKQFDYHRELVSLGDALLDSRCIETTSLTISTNSLAEVSPADCHLLAKVVVGELRTAIDVASEHSSATGNNWMVDGGAFSAAATSYIFMDDRLSAASSRIAAATAFADAGRSISAYRELQRIGDEGLEKYMSINQLSAFNHLLETVPAPQSKK
jgi:tetratricopeptide (TPR) repeat protein